MKEEWVLEIKRQCVKYKAPFFLNNGVVCVRKKTAGFF